MLIRCRRRSWRCGELARISGVSQGTRPQGHAPGGDRQVTWLGGCHEHLFFRGDMIAMSGALPYHRRLRYNQTQADPSAERSLRCGNVLSLLCRHFYYSYANITFFRLRLQKCSKESRCRYKLAKQDGMKKKNPWHWILPIRYTFAYFLWIFFRIHVI